ncbi:MAG: cellobiose phosphorylase, partial [Candidatus Omnitrophica bacterium]|nr:cellobiose phosphorylase [Candidatus Omnitrophota bacterium]
ILELLKKELVEEFYNDFKKVLVCFQNPRIYGRNPLENSSFIVSSAFSDKKLIGTGFVARLSGSTAEFLEIWLIMNVGDKPFFLDKEGKLNLEFKPKLVGWLFKKDGTYKFKFLGETEVVYHNPKRKNTFAKNGSRIRKIIFSDKDGSIVKLESSVIPPPYAEQVRLGQIKKIDIYLE